VARVCAGDGSLVLIEGPAGIGKTRLLDAALEIAAAAGLTTHRARASELERAIPHSITRQLFEPRLAHAGEAEREELLRDAAASASTVFFGPDLGSASPGESPFAVLHGLYWMVVNMAERAPLALAIDDAHWADAASLRALAYLANRMADLALLILVAMRPFEPDAELGLLDEIASHPLACPVRPAALSELAVGELLAQTLGGQVDPAFVRACHEATSGNPFFLKEVLSAVLAEGVSPTAGEAARAFELAPPTVARSVQRRLERLPDAVLALARAVAILAESPRPLVAAEVSGLEPAVASDSATALSRAEILQPESLEFAHPIVRSVVYSGMSPVERGELHRDAARALANARAPDTEIGAQLLASRPQGDP
jgi:predicted ATPase